MLTIPTYTQSTKLMKIMKKVDSHELKTRFRNQKSFRANIGYITEKQNIIGQYQK